MSVNRFTSCPPASVLPSAGPPVTMSHVDPSRLSWQSKLVLLLILPAVAASLFLEGAWWLTQQAPVALWTLALSGLLGLVAWRMRSATPGAAVTGAVITASLMFSTATAPYLPWRTALVPVLVVLILTSIATRLGRRRKEQLGTAEPRSGRRSSQVAANLGMATLASFPVAQSWQFDQSWLGLVKMAPSAVFIAGLAALCEAAADTVSSEMGQVLSGRPRMITSLCLAPAGTDGAISLPGTLAGVTAAALVAAAGTLALGGGTVLFALSSLGGIFGLFVDSLLGATLERLGWLNNDAVNFLSTLSSAAFSLCLLALFAHAQH
jgi:uncharacterized protein (TIGR00297 family)